MENEKDDFYSSIMPAIEAVDDDGDEEDSNENDDQEIGGGIEILNDDGDEFQNQEQDGRGDEEQLAIVYEKYNTNEDDGEQNYYQASSSAYSAAGDGNNYFQEQNAYENFEQQPQVQQQKRSRKSDLSAIASSSVTSTDFPSIDDLLKDAFYWRTFPETKSNQITSSNKHPNSNFQKFQPNQDNGGGASSLVFHEDYYYRNFGADSAASSSRKQQNSKNNDYDSASDLKILNFQDYNDEFRGGSTSATSKFRKILPRTSGGGGTVGESSSTTSSDFHSKNSPHVQQQQHPTSSIFSRQNLMLKTTKTPRISILANRPIAAKTSSSTNGAAGHVSNLDSSVDDGGSGSAANSGNFRCPLCPMNFHKKSDVEDHVRKSHDDEINVLNGVVNPPVVQPTPMPNYLEQELAFHYEKPAAEKNRCNVCGKEGFQDVSRHVNKMHPSWVPCLFSLCTAWFINTSARAQHLLSAHPKNYVNRLPSAALATATKSATSSAAASVVVVQGSLETEKDSDCEEIVDSSSDKEAKKKTTPDQDLERKLAATRSKVPIDNEAYTKMARADCEAYSRWRTAKATKEAFRLKAAMTMEREKTIVKTVATPLPAPTTTATKRKRKKANDSDEDWQESQETNRRSRRKRPTQRMPILKRPPDFGMPNLKSNETTNDSDDSEIKIVANSTNRSFEVVDIEAEERKQRPYKITTMKPVAEGTTCNICYRKLVYSDKEKLRAHMQQAHATTLQCPLCQRWYGGVIALREHMIHDHGLHYTPVAPTPPRR